MHQHPGDDYTHQNHIGESTSPSSAFEVIDGAGARRAADRHAWHRAMSSADDLALRRNDGRARVGTSRVKVVLGRLYTYMDGPDGRDPGGNARPGPDRLAAETNMSVADVKAALRAGQQHGWIVQTDPGGGRGRAATYAATWPVDNLKRGGRDHPFPNEKGWSGPPVSPERGGRDQQKGWSGPPPPSITEQTPPSSAPERARQLPLTAAVDAGEGERLPAPNPTGPRPAQVARRLADRLGLQLTGCPPALAAAVKARLAEGWTPDDLAAAGPVTAPLPADVVSPAGLLRTRLEQLADVDPPTVAAERRRQQLQAEIDAAEPLRAPGRPAGPTVDLDDLHRPDDERAG